MDIKEESLRKALAAVGLSNLPRQYNASSQEFWLKAIVLVRKRNMEESYCLYDRKASGLMELVRDFGSASVIFSVKTGVLRIRGCIYSMSLTRTIRIGSISRLWMRSNLTK